MPCQRAQTIARPGLAFISSHTTCERGGGALASSPLSEKFSLIEAVSRNLCPCSHLCACLLRQQTIRGLASHALVCLPLLFRRSSVLYDRARLVRRVLAFVLVCRFGFDVAHYREMSPRKEKGSPVQGQLIALVKRGEGEQQRQQQPEEAAQQEPDDTGNEL